MGFSTDMYLDQVSKIGVCITFERGRYEFIYLRCLYDYALSLNANNGIVPTCLSAGLINLKPSQKKLIQILDLLGRETTFKPNTPLIYVYDDGSIKKGVSVIWIL